MLIDLSELLSVNGKSEDVQIEIEMDRFRSKMADYFISRKAPLQIRLTNTGRKMIRIETVIDIMLLIPCDRCLEDVKYDLSIEVDKEINMDEMKFVEEIENMLKRY